MTCVTLEPVDRGRNRARCPVFIFPDYWRNGWEPGGLPRFFNPGFLTCRFVGFEATARGRPRTLWLSFQAPNPREIPFKGTPLCIFMHRAPDVIHTPTTLSSPAIRMHIDEFLSTRAPALHNGPYQRT